VSLTVDGVALRGSQHGECILDDARGLTAQRQRKVLGALRRHELAQDERAMVANGCEHGTLQPLDFVRQAQRILLTHLAELACRAARLCARTATT